MTEQPHPLLVARDVELGYDNEPSILTGVNFEIYPKQFVGIAGPNGAGKTTFVRSILGLITPRKGQIHYYSPQGQPLNAISIGYMPQQNHLDKAFPIRVKEIVRSGLYGLHAAVHSPHSKVKEALERVGMWQEADTTIGHLSGGQLQRVLLARAFVSNPMLLVLDEPTTFVDRQFEETMLSLLPELQQQSAIVMVSHNDQMLRDLTSRVYYVDHSLR